MKTLTVIPFLVAMFAAVTAMPTNVYQICAWNAGTLHIEPWRNRAAAALRSATQGIRAWLNAIWSPRVAFACLAVMLALLLAQHGVGDVLLAVALPVGTLKTKRATILREAESLRGADGMFADDAARTTFDAKMAEIEALDDQIRLLPGGNDDPPEPNERDLGADAERTRVQGILLATRSARLTQAFADKLINDKVSLVDAQTRVFTELAARESNVPRGGAGPVIMGDDPLVAVRAGIENAILHRVSPALFKLEDNGKPYRGMTLLDIARSFLQARGVRTTGFSKMELAAAALGLSGRGGMHTTSDFAYLLADVASKTLRKAYDEAPQTFTAIGRRVTLPDFKPVYRTQLGDAPQLLEVKEHGEFKRGTIGEGRETFQLATYGRVFAITRKALVNDDTDAFGRVATLFGRAARALESNLAWQQIYDNPVMGDGNAVFSAAHNNLDASGDVLSIASIGAARAAMRNQSSLDGELLNITPKYLIVPPDLETKADQFVSTNVGAGSVGDVNPFSGKLTVIAEPRLTDALAWYLAASPEQIDMLEYGTLEGEDGPMIESRVGFDVDGLEVKARHDFAAKVIDWRGFYKNAGDNES